MATLLCVYIACTIPQITILMYFIASLFIMGIMLEKMFVTAVISFIAVAFLAFLIVPSKYMILPYIIFFGHYGIFKFVVDANVESSVGCAIVKIVYFNIALFVMYMFDNTLFTGEIAKVISIWVIVIIAEVIFIIYDIIFTKLSTAYYDHGRQAFLNANRYD